MVHLTSTNGHAQVSNVNDPGYLDQTHDDTWLPHTSHITHDMPSSERGSKTISHTEQQVGLILPKGHGRRPTNGSVGQIYAEKLREPSPRRLLRRPSTARSLGRKSSSKEDDPASTRNGTHHTSMAETSLQTPKKRKKGGFGTVIRRLFGRRSVKNRISLPAPVNHQKHVSYSRRKLWDVADIVRRTRTPSSPLLLISNLNVRHRSHQQDFCGRAL